MHDLTTDACIVPPNLSALIGLGSKFCPIERFANHNPSETINRFRKYLYTKVYYAGRDLSQDEDYIPQIHVPSTWEPLPFDLPSIITDQFSHFEFNLRKMFNKNVENLTTSSPSRSLP